MTTHRSITASIAAALFLPASAYAATICVNPASPLCHSTIQLGVNAAGPGDIVRIAAGTYFESVAVPSGKDGIQLLGASKLTTILDSAPYTDRLFVGGIAIDVASRRVTIKNLMVRNGSIYVLTPEAHIQGLNVTGTNGPAINLSSGAVYSTVLQNEIHYAETGILSGAFGTVVQSNVITGTQTGILLAGNAAQAISNKVVNGDSGIIATRDGAVVKTNDVRHQLDIAIMVQGKFPTVQGNNVYGAHLGIQVACTDCFGGTVASNTVTDATGYGILASADDFGLVLERNVLLRTGLGLSLNGFGITARLNRVSDVGLDLFGHCYEVFGEWHTLVQNTAARCSQAGVFASGRAMELDRNSISGTFENGITVDAGSFRVVVTGNKANGNAAQGIAVLNSTDTLVTGNTAMGNRRDFCNDSFSASVIGNTFGTSFDTPGVDCTIAHIP